MNLRVQKEINMKSNKILALTLSIMLGTSALLNSGLVYADNIDTTKKEMPKKIENEIIGKITSISATSLTAKTVRDARFGGPRGMRPNGEPQKQQQQQQ